MIKKTEFVRKLSAETGYSQKDIASVLDGLRTVVVDIVKSQESVRVFEGLTIEGKEVPAHDARNPRTGETVEVPAKIKPTARFGETFKAEINE